MLISLQNLYEFLSSVENIYILKNLILLIIYGGELFSNYSFNIKGKVVRFKLLTLPFIFY